MGLSLGGRFNEAYTECCLTREYGKPDSKLPHCQLPGYAQELSVRPAPVIGGNPPALTGRKKALLIGCNYPGTAAALDGCINDVYRMLKLLRTRYDFSSQDVRILTDDGQGPHGSPTRAAIVANMRWLVEGVQPGDVLFFHFSGHGAQQLDPTYAEEDGYDETILPTDFDHAGMIVDDEIFDTICAPLPSGAKLTAVMDCCHSGTGMDVPFAWDIEHYRWTEEDNPFHSAGDVTLLSGCMDDQCSADASDVRGRAGGAMTTALCDVLEDDHWADSMGYTQLLHAMHMKLSQRGFDQRPNLGSSQAFDVSSRPFGISGTIVPNMNETLGRHFRKSKHPKRDFAGQFGEMLNAVAQGMALMSLVQGVGNLAHHHGDGGGASFPLAPGGAAVAGDSGGTGGGPSGDTSSTETAMRGGHAAPPGDQPVQPEAHAAGDDHSTETGKADHEEESEEEEDSASEYSSDGAEHVDMGAGLGYDEEEEDDDEW